MTPPKQRKNITNRDLQKQIDAFNIEFTKDMNALKEFSQLVATALETLNDNVAANMLNIREVRSMVEEVAKVQKEDENKGLYT